MYVVNASLAIAAAIDMCFEGSTIELSLRYRHDAA